MQCYFVSKENRAVNGTALNHVEMEHKKNPFYNLERKKPTLLLAGFMGALALTLAAFEYRTAEIRDVHLGVLDIQFMEEEIIPVSKLKAPPPPPPPPPADQFEISDELPEFDETEILEPLDIPDFPDVPEVYEIDEVVEIIFEPPVYDFAEVMPSFPGGEEALYRYLGEVVKYPKEALRAGVGGKVFVVFVVNTDGTITDIAIEHGVGWGLDEEVLRAVSGMPKWNPGMQGGHKVAVRLRLPVGFGQR